MGHDSGSSSSSSSSSSDSDDSLDKLLAGSDDSDDSLDKLLADAKKDDDDDDDKKTSAAAAAASAAASAGGGGFRGARPSAGSTAARGSVSGVGLGAGRGLAELAKGPFAPQIMQWIEEGDMVKLEDVPRDKLVHCVQEMRDEDGRTPLLIALEEAPDNMEEVVNFLLDHGKAGVTVNEESMGFSGGTAMHQACEKGNLELMHRFLEAGAEVNALDTSGETPLHRLCESDDLKQEDAQEAIFMMIRAGADPNVVTRQNKNCIFLLCESMINSLEFHENGKVLKKVDRNRLHACFDMLDALLDDGTANKIHNDEDDAKADKKAKAGKDKKKKQLNVGLRASARVYGISRMNRKEYTPLGMLVRVIIILDRAVLAARTARVQRDKEELALLNLLRVARYLIDKKAPLHTNFEEGEGTILDAIIRNEVRLLVIHEKIQKQLNIAWGPDLTYEGDGWFYDNNTNDYLTTPMELAKSTWNSRRCRFAISAITYFLWMVLISTAAVRTYTGTGVDEFFLADTVRDRYVRDELPVVPGDNDFLTAFEDVENQGDVALWLAGPFAGASTDQFRFDARVAPARVRLFRYKLRYSDTEGDEQGDGCAPLRFPENLNYPQATFDPENRSQPANENLTVLCANTLEAPLDAKFGDDEVFNIKWQQPTTEIEGRLTRIYGNDGGYVINIPMDASESVLGVNSTVNEPLDGVTGICDGLDVENTMNCLTGNGWLGQDTAVLFAEEAVYNPSLGRFALFRAVVEFPRSGKTWPWQTTDVVYMPYQFVNGGEYVTIAIEFIVFVIWAINFVREISQFYSDKWGYLRDKWNLNDIVVLFLFLGMIIARFVTALMAANVDKDFDSLRLLAERQRSEKQLVSTLIIFLWIGALKFLRVIPDVGILLRIIKREIRDVVVFLGVYFALLLGFALAFNLLIGSDAASFRTIWLSIVVMARMTTGDFDFGEIAAANRWFAIILFFLFLVASAILLLNLLIAMLNQSYADVLEGAVAEFMCERAKLIASYDAATMEDKKDWSLVEMETSYLNRDREGMDTWLKQFKKKHFKKQKKKDDSDSWGDSSDSLDLSDLLAGFDNDSDDVSMDPELAALLDGLDLDDDDDKKKKDEKPKNLGDIASGAKDFKILELGWSSDVGVVATLGAENIKVTASPMGKGKPSDFLVDYKKLALAQRKAKRAARGDAKKGKKGKKGKAEDDDSSDSDSDTDIECPSDTDDQPRTANVPLAQVTFDIGATNRLICSGVRFKWFTPDYDDEDKDGEFFPVQFMIQGSNDPKCVDAASPDDPVWQTLTVHSEDTSYWSNVDSNDVDIHWRPANRQLMAFRFFRVIQTGPNCHGAWVKSNRRWQFSQADKAAFDAKFAKISARLSHVLSFCGFEMAGGLMTGFSEDFLKTHDYVPPVWEERTRVSPALATSDIDKKVLSAKKAKGKKDGSGDGDIAPGAGDDDDDEAEARETAAARAKREADKARAEEAAARAAQEALVATMDPQQRKLFDALATHVGFETTTLRSTFEGRFTAMAARLHAMESSLEYVENNIDVTAREFVYSSSER